MNANIDASVSSPMILLVDDDVLILKLLARALEAAGFQVALAEPAVTRQEAGADVPGLVVALRKD